jgi:hypothetical protein
MSLLRPQTKDLPIGIVDEADEVSNVLVRHVHELFEAGKVVDAAIGEV